MAATLLTQDHHLAGVEPVPVVSAIIIFLNEEKFIREAIESVLVQTYKEWELLLVDDGSTDQSTEIARRYALEYPDRIRYLEHPGHQNRGMSASRNLGLTHARGEFVAFLDGDDVWLPRKLEEQLEILNSNPEAAVVYGATRYWYSWSGRVEDAGRDFVPDLGVPSNKILEPPVFANALLQNQVATSTAALTRRGALQQVGGYEESFEGMFEDQVLSSKIGLVMPIFVSNKCWYNYRRHAESCCAIAEASGKDLTKRVAFLDWLDAYIADNGISALALRKTIKRERWKARHPKTAGFGAAVRYRGRILREAVKNAVRRFLPQSISSRVRRGAGEKVPPVGLVRFGDLRRITPISRVFGFDRGTPVDRYYIENFLQASAADIRGDVLEVGDDTYTRRFGGDRVIRTDVLHVSENNNRATIVTDLADAPGIPSNYFDCIVLTQTLQLIYDVRAAIRTLHRILKPGGVLLVTIPGISQIDHYEWRDSWYWAFTTMSAKRLFEEVFSAIEVETRVYGNVLAATAFLQGIVVEELKPDELEHSDPDYQLLITVRARKGSAV